MQDFINLLKNHKYWKYVINRDDIVCAFLAGSRSNGLDDDQSDYDIVVLTLNTPDKEEGLYYLEYQGVSVHWYYRSLEHLISNKTNVNSRLSYFSGINLRNLEKTLMYVNPKYQNYYNWIVQNRDLLVFYNCWEFILNNPFFYNLSIADSVTDDNLVKFLYHFCTCKAIIFKEELDKDFLKRVKRIIKTHDGEKKEEDLKRVLQNIKDLDYYRKTHDLKRQENYDYLYKTLKEVDN